MYIQEIIKRTLKIVFPENVFYLWPYFTDKRQCNILYYFLQKKKKKILVSHSFVFIFGSHMCASDRLHVAGRTGARRLIAARIWARRIHTYTSIDGRQRVEEERNFERKDVLTKTFGNVKHKPLSLCVYMTTTRRWQWR